MVRYLIQRPISVLTIFVALLLAGLAAIKRVPVALLPDIDIPTIIVRVNYANYPAGIIEQNIIKPIREDLSHANHLRDIESTSANYTGVVYLYFDYNTNMGLAYIEVNEKLDQITAALPHDMPRPEVIRVSTQDVPVLRVEVSPANDVSYAQVSALAEKVLKKRLEQIEGVSLVDINGATHERISVSPDIYALHALGLDESALVKAIREANLDLGGLHIKNGQYTYFVELASAISDPSAIGNIAVSLKDGGSMPLNRLARVREEEEKPLGYHLFMGHRALVLTVQKQPDSRMNDLVPRIKEVVRQFQADYPQVSFAISQDQSWLLDAGISNLYQDLIYGGILTVAILFLFLGNWASCVLMCISIPISLLITFILFYLFNISFNIISLSGLALGIGMLIDNSIIVIDNITKKRAAGLDMLNSSVEGTNEVITPVISQVLTTVGVYAPLVLLSGLAGSLIYDQSIALTFCLGISLAVAFILTPLLYKLFLTAPAERVKRDTIFYTAVAKGYHRMIHHIFKHKLFYFIFTLALMPIGFLLIYRLPASSLPKIEKKESLLLIDWNDPIDAGENLRRVRSLQPLILARATACEAEVGVRQFLLQQDNNSIEKSEIYYSAADEKTKLTLDEAARQWFREKYPKASLHIIDAPNAFTQLFTSQTPWLEARFTPIGKNTVDGYPGFDELLKALPVRGYLPGKGLLTEPGLTISLDYKKMMLYGVSAATLEDVLQRQFGTYIIAQIRQFGYLEPIALTTADSSVASKLSVMVAGANNTLYPLSEFILLQNDMEHKVITADRTGPYRSIEYPETVKDVPAVRKTLENMAARYGFTVRFTGKYFENRQSLKELWWIFLIVLVLIYFILAIQYEDLLLPLIVMLTIPLGITGSLFLLWCTGGTIDVMAGIGFVVLLGLIVDDPILKVETLHRLQKKYLAAGVVFDDRLLEQMLHEAGDICLKPLLMVSLTTSIALLPVLFVGGIGNDLQKPLSIIIIGGLTIGTFFTTWFIPLAFWYVTKWKKRKYAQV